MLFSIIVLVALFFFELGYLKIAKKFGIIDNPNYRSAHVKPTIRGGGIVLVPAVFIFLFFYSPQISDYIGLSFAVLLLAIVSFIDDLKPLSSKIRIAVHFIAFTIIFFTLGFFQGFSFYSILIIISTYVFSLGFLNIYNFMDGINGLTFLNALTTYVTFFVIDVYMCPFSNSDLLLLLIMAVSVFGFFNFRTLPKCFAGDVGSITIGFTVIYFTVKLFIVTNNFAIFLLLGVYLMDGGWTIVERIIRKENILEAHRRHLYQLLVNEIKVPHLKVSIGYFILQLLLNTIVICLLIKEGNHLLISILLFGLFSFLYFLIKKNTYKKVAAINER
jgi:UDP-N-acetylmuramyl pentapeptide phosphotransferase/UDP-N-acetylglucosamine-1-phosphate transferase